MAGKIMVVDDEAQMVQATKKRALNHRYFETEEQSFKWLKTGE